MSIPECPDEKHDGINDRDKHKKKGSYPLPDSKGSFCLLLVLVRLGIRLLILIILLIGIRLLILSLLVLVILVI